MSRESKQWFRETMCMCTDLCVAERITEYDKANAEYDKMNMIKYKHLGKVRKEYQEFFVLLLQLF